LYIIFFVSHEDNLVNGLVRASTLKFMPSWHREELKRNYISGKELVEERKTRCLPILRGFYRWLLQKSVAVLGELSKSLERAPP
jgi:hypothetical protein